MEKRRLGRVPGGRSRSRSLDQGQQPRFQNPTLDLISRGAALSEVFEEEADGAIPLALEVGVYRCDTVAGCGDSEPHYGRWMSRMRDRNFFLRRPTRALRAPRAARSKPPSNA